MKYKLAILLLSAATGVGCSPKEPAATDATTTTSVVASSTVTQTSTESTSSAASENVSINFMNTYWKLVGLNGKDVVVIDQQREPHIVFGEDNRVSGSDGCNRFMGGYQHTDTELTFSQMAGTKMACMEGDEQAQAFTDGLSQVSHYQLQGEHLDLKDNTDKVIARFIAVALP
ncbi:META domain-containing protein [Cellvibrio sp. UBA7661]|uniref:META domain-containing protein n=1 Tax=Cellvibrio sp. UBA7661 TaxID=1946311 RepID=UPI002F3547B0